MTRPDNIKEDVPIAPHTTLKVGGPARYFAPCDSIEDLQRVLKWSEDKALAVFVLGGGSNILVSDAGFDGVVVKYRGSQARFSAAKEYVDVDADAGADWDELVQKCVDEQLSGIECLSGIPGLVGAAPIQNIGAYGQEVATAIQSVSGIDMTSMQQIEIPASDCGFCYRTSHFKTHWKSFIVTAVRFRLSRNDVGLVQYPDLRRVLSIDGQSAARPTVAETRAAVIGVRRDKSMVISADDPNRRSVGSFFLNPVLSEQEYEEVAHKARKDSITESVPSFTANGGRVKVPAAWLIEHAGFSRGISNGKVGLSSRHALAVINRGGATAKDIVAFAARVRQAVKNTFGVSLFPEPVFVGFDTDPDSLLSINESDSHGSG